MRLHICTPRSVRTKSSPRSKLRCRRGLFSPTTAPWSFPMTVRWAGTKVIGRKATQMGSEITPGTTNGHALRKNPSWISSFVDSTARLESPRVFRLWAAISVLGAAVEQRVWMISQGRKVYPNLYCGLVAHPGTRLLLPHHIRFLRRKDRWR